MPDGPANDNNAPTLLSAVEPSPYFVTNSVSEFPVLLVCDHASCRFPQSLGDMGLDPFARRCHLAIDIGAGSLTEALSDSLGAAAVLAQYSRLVIDCNRELLDPGAFLEFGDGIIVPGNRNLRPEDKAARADEIYWPYHHAIDQQIKRLKTIGPPPAFIAIHSFTPVLNGQARPWQVGVLWDADSRLSDIFIDEFRAAGFVTGDNEPYSGKAPQDFTVDHHAEQGRLRHAAIEVRQDLIDHEEGAARVATVLHRIIEQIPGRIGLQGQRISA